MLTLLFGHVPVLSQMTEVHASFLMMKRSVSVCIIMLQLWGRKVCNCANADVCVVKSLKGSSVMPAVHMHNFESISAAEEIIHIKPCCL